MKKVFTKTIKIGKLTISIIPNEIMVIYVGKGKIFIKNFRKPVNPISKKIILSAVGSIVLIFLVISLIPSDGGTNNLNDDELKQKLLEEAQYSNPDNSTELRIVTHTVKRGENLSKIAQKFGISIDTICGSNNLRSYDMIREGTVLRIPNKDGILYKINRGNSIVSLAQKYKISLRKILHQNNLRNPDFITVGTVIFIPDAKPQNILPGFMWPTGTRAITCGYGWRRNPFNRGNREFHQGLDIRARYAWVRASKYGKISFTGWMGGYGRTVIVAHPGGWKTVYAHLSRIIVRTGQHVKQGQYVAKSGNTGRSTGPHLHFEIIKRGRHKNPYVYLRKGRR